MSEPDGPKMADPMQVYPMGPPPRQGETYPPQTAPPSNNPPQGGYPSQHIPQGGYPPEYPSQGNHLPPQGVYSEEFKKSPDYGGYYEEAADSKLAESFNFDNASIRRGFIRKVYAILSVQLGITLSVICWFLFDRTTQEFVQANPLLLIIWTVIVFVSLIFLACCGDLRRKAPLNYILLILFTVAESFTVGTLTSFFEVNAVAMAVGITAVVCLGLTLFAFQTKWDFTLLGGVLFVTLLILMVSGIFAACFRTEGANIAYAALGAALFSIYLIYDTQLMMGGQHKYSISPEEYIFAAINLYVDVINLFLYILLLFARRR